MKRFLPLRRLSSLLLALFFVGLSVRLSAAATSATVNVNAGTVVNAFNYRYLYGSNSVLWLAASRYNNVKTSLQQSGTYFIRGLGGSFADTYHWNGNGSYDADGVWHCDDTVWTKGFTDTPLYDVAKVYDGDTSNASQWRSITNTATAWIWVKLGASTSINGVRIDWDSPYAVNYQIQVWNTGSYAWAPHEANSSSWVTVATVTGATGGVDIRAIPATTGSVFRLLMTSSSGQGFRVNELELDSGGVKQTITGGAASPTSGANKFGANYWGGDFETFMTFVHSMGTQAVPLITVNVGTGTPEEAAAWVHYANVVKGYGIQYWEIGNEMAGAWEAGGPIDADEYARRYIQYAQAMRAVDPSVKLYGPTNGLDTNSERYDGLTYAERFLQDLSSQGQMGLLDGLSNHEYPDFNNTNPVTSLQNTSKWTAWKTFVENLYSTYAGGPQAKELLMSEYNSGSATQAMTMQAANALWVADWLARFASAFGLRAKTCMWDIMNGSVSSGGGDHGLFESGQTGAPYPQQPRPDYWALHMMDQHFSVEDEAGNSLVSASSNQSLLPVYANLRSDGRLALMVINESPSTTYAATLNIAGFSVSPTAKVWTWGDSALAPYYVDNWNWIGSASPPYADVDLSPSAGVISNAGASFAFTFPPYSLTILQCDPSVPLPTATPTPTSSPSPSATPTRSPTPSRTATASATPTRTFSASPSPTDSPTPSRTFSASPSPSDSPTPSQTFSVSPSPTDSPTPSQTFSVSPSPTESPTPSRTYSASPSPTDSPTPSLTFSASPSPSDSPTSTLGPSASATPSASPTDTPTETPGPPSPTPTATLSPSASPILSPTPSATANAAWVAGGLRLVDLAFVPQPNPSRLAFKLEGKGDHLRLIFYSPALIRQEQLDWNGTWSEGWNSVALPTDLSSRLGPGLHFGRLSVDGGSRQALGHKTGRFYVVR